MHSLKRCLLIGNSRWHWAIKKTNQWDFVHTSPKPHTFASNKESLLAWAAVGPIPSEISLNPTLRLSTQDVPLLNLPHWLGIDRALAGWGAFQKAKTSNISSSGILIADAGTILSLTRITVDGAFAGGQLVPGLRLQLTAMADGALNLKDPGLSLFNTPKFPLKTGEAMQRGSLQSLLGTIVEALREEQMPIWLCGGDAPILYEELKQRNIKVFHHPNLVLEGMVDLYLQINQDQDL